MAAGPLEEPAAHAESLVIRAGSLVGSATLIALFGTLPAAWRIGTHHEGIPLLGSWLALGAVALLPAIGAVVVARGARMSLRAMSTNENHVHFLAFSIWSLLMLSTLIPFGAVLRAKTHHQPLAGVTFGIGALACALVFGLVSRRTAKSIAALGTWLRRIFTLAVAVFLALGLAAVALRVGPETRPIVIDMLACTVMVRVASGHAGLDARARAVLGPPIGATLFVLGMATLRAGVLAGTEAERPFFSPLVQLVASGGANAVQEDPGR